MSSFRNGKLSGEGSGTPLQYSCLENPMDRGASPVGCGPRGSRKSRTWLSDWSELIREWSGHVFYDLVSEVTYYFCHVLFIISKSVSLACHAEWSKAERGKQISCINTYIWNLGKWYWWTYLQGRNRGTDVENGLVDTVGEQTERTALTYTHTHIYTHYYVLNR